MTRLEQALRWWRNHVDYGELVPIPRRHFAVLDNAGMVRPDEDEGYSLSEKGRVALDPTPDAEKG